MATEADLTHYFRKDFSEYRRSIKPVEHYITQMAFYLHKQTGDAIEKCRAFIVDGIKNNKFEGVRNPNVVFYKRAENGDRAREEISLTGYIQEVLDNHEILAPSFTTYLHPSIKVSLISNYATSNVKTRSIAKKASQKAKAQGNMPVYLAKDNEQTNRKQTNNSLSGAFNAGGSPLNNPSAHSTLTSTTRTVTSFGNAVNEKMVMGNRHYWSPAVALYNVISVTANFDRVDLENTMVKYGLVCPTVDDVMDCITYSSDLYWRDRKKTQEIRDYVVTLTPVERAAFVYIGDLYHIRKHNPEMVRRFISALAKKDTTVLENPLEEVKSLGESVLNLAHHICYDEAKGKGKDYKLFNSEGVLSTVVSTSKHILSTLEEMKPFITTFMLSDNVPASVAYIRNMLRRCVTVSDTDSTCAAYEDWVEWYFGSSRFDAESIAVSGAVMTLSTQSIAHVLATLSANIGVEKSKLGTLAMKNEWFWTVMIPMNVSKHYCAAAHIQEGNVFKEPELELKGVHLRNSNTPPAINEDAKRMMLEIIDNIETGKKVSLQKLVGEVVDMEKHVSHSLLAGELEFYRGGKIKEAEAYSKGPDESPYQHHLLWEQVFAPKYGAVQSPTYAVAKVATQMDNKSKLKAWLDSMEDRALADRMGAWLAAHNKSALPTMYISANYLKSNGMIPEIKPVIDTDRIVVDLCNVYYMLMESMGYYSNVKPLSHRHFVVQPV